jgi:hypothetical protein
MNTKVNIPCSAIRVCDTVIKLSLLCSVYMMLRIEFGTTVLLIDTSGGNCLYNLNHERKDQDSAVILWID